MMGHLVKLHICVDQSVAVYRLQIFWWGRIKFITLNIYHYRTKTSGYSLALCTLHIVIHNLNIKSLMYLQACVNSHSGPDFHLPSVHSNLGVLEM
jgi:hypothetical protein